MFNTNTSKAEKLISKSQARKKIFASLKSDLVETNKEMLIEASELSKQIKLLQSQQADLASESLSNETVVKNIDSILGITN